MLIHDPGPYEARINNEKAKNESWIGNYDNPPGSIHSVSGPCLGDLWASLNFFNHLSIKTNSVVRISELVGRNSVKNKLIESLEVLLGPGQLEIVPEKANQERLPYHFSCNYFRTKWVWKKRPNSRMICYQFDAMTGKREQRRPTQEEIDEFKERAVEAGWWLEDIGGHRDLKEGVRIASMSYAYVGVISGLAEVCTSVGVPMHIVVNDFPMGWAKAMYAGRFGRIYGRLPEIDLDRLHENVGMI